MDKDWKDFNVTKPIFTTVKDDIKISDQIFLYIDDKLYLGYYISSLFYDADNDTHEWDCFIELARYSLTEVSEKYIQNDDIYQDEFNKHDIYWHYIDTLGIICSVDLQKMQREEKNDGNIKA